MIETRELEARTFELAAGVQRPGAAREHLVELERSGELVSLEGGWWTTRELRDLEHRALDAARGRSNDRAGAASPDAREAGLDAAAHRRGDALSQEQADALETITGEAVHWVTAVRHIAQYLLTFLPRLIRQQRADLPERDPARWN